MNELQYLNLRPEHAKRVAALMAICFPQIGEEDLLTPAEFHHIATLFPAGTFVVLDGERTVGLGTGLFLDIDFTNLPATEHILIGGHHYTNHDPNGDYYYGMGICVHPAYRRRGIGRALYELRKELVRQQQRKGFVAAGVLADYAAHKSIMSAPDYVDKVVAGTLYDATLTTQLNNGFHVQQVLQGFFADEATDNWSTLIVWEGE